MAISLACVFPGSAVSASAESEQARQILDATGVKGGLIVHLGCDDGKLTAALRADESYLVHGLDVDAKDVGKARAHILSLGLYGNVSVDRLGSGPLPYIDNLVNLVVSEDLGKVSMEEVRRVLVPNGVAYIKKGGKWTKTIKPRPKEIDEWTHYLHDASNNAVAHDDLIAPLGRYQWVGSPRYSRQHDHMSSVNATVSANGRVFYIFDEVPRSSILIPPRWVLIARDAFNGTILWKRSIGRWHCHLWPLKSGPQMMTRRLVAAGDRVYVTLSIDAPLTALDAATGETVRTYEGTKATEEILFCDGMLLLVVATEGQPLRSDPSKSYANMQEVRKDVTNPLWTQAPRAVMAVNADTGKVVWSKESDVVPMTLTADSQRVLFHDGEKIQCLNRQSGQAMWASEPLAKKEKMRSSQAPTLVVYDDVVLYSGFVATEKYKQRDSTTMFALSARDGKLLWKAEHPPCGHVGTPKDILVAGGLVWCGAVAQGSNSGIMTGRDLRTGEVKSEFPPDVTTYWFHHRCYRAKATDNYLLFSRTGIEFIDIKKKHWVCHHWVRGACLYGIMPANGLVYAPQHPCACYLEAKLYGFTALAPGRGEERGTGSEERLERGPAYDQIANRQSETANPHDWPTYRNNPSRSAFTKASVPTDLKRAWQTELGGKLSSVVIAGGKLFVASIDIHTVHALDVNTGRPTWAFTAGGRVDSPPTIWQGRVLFGSADGHVYCLRASDGELIWRFRAAPEDRRMEAFEQVESVWPVHGSVLMQNDVLYCVAGRSMFLDGGLRLLRLAPKTGRKLSETILDDRDPETGKNLQMYVKGLDMTVALPDVLSSDGKHVYMRSMPFDLQGARQRIAYTNVREQRGEDAHLFSPTGFLDGSNWHRTYWVFGRSMASGAGGYYQAGRVAPAGRILVIDDASIYGFGRKAKYYRWTTPLEFHLFATSKEIPVFDRKAAKRSSPCIGVEKSKSLNPAGKPLSVEAWIRAAKGDGVVVARGGPAHGYALFVKGGRPQFAVRVKNEVDEVSAKEKVVGKWVHLVGVLTDDKKLQIYVNGKLAGSAEASGFVASDPAQPMEIGCDDGGNAGDYRSPFGFNGIIDEVRVYHRALSADEIARHTSAPDKVANPDEGLVLYYSFDKGDATDLSGNKNDGTVEGAKPTEGKFGNAMKVVGRKRGLRTLPYIVKHRWTQDVPLHAQAMVLAGQTLFVAGPPDVLDEDDASRRFGEQEIQAKLHEQRAALEGEAGALLWAVSTSDGSKLAEYKLDSLPVWDGMAAANERLYLSTRAGAVLCLGSSD